MKFASIFVSALTVACANAIAAFGNAEFPVQAGKPFTIEWFGQVSPTIDLKLKNGVKGDLKDVLTIATGVSGTKFTWTPPATLPTDLYAFEIIDGGKPNWSMQFQFQGAGPASSSSSSKPPTSTSSSSSASSSQTSSSTTSAPSSSSTGPTQSTSTSSSARPTQTGGTINPPNSGMKYQSSPLALIAVMVATFLYLN
jgi:hypothetical protein